MERKRLFVKRAGLGGNILARGLVIAAPRSGSGKTVLTLGLMRSYRNAGLTVAGAKCGPDYIDPSYHTAVCGRASRNLDGWMVGRAASAELFHRAIVDADVAVVEGVMGLYDGRHGSVYRCNDDQREKCRAKFPAH